MPCHLEFTSIQQDLLRAPTVCEKQFLPQGTYTVIGRKHMHAHRKINTKDAKCYELGKGKTSYPIKGFQRGLLEITLRNGQNLDRTGENSISKGNSGKPPCMSRKQ